jgi:hypothetical protein
MTGDRLPLLPSISIPGSIITGMHAASRKRPFSYDEDKYTGAGMRGGYSDVSKEHEYDDSEDGGGKRGY